MLLCEAQMWEKKREYIKLHADDDAFSLLSILSEAIPWSKYTKGEGALILFVQEVCACGCVALCVYVLYMCVCVHLSRSEDTIRRYILDQNSTSVRY